jgi:hypothetical protein
MQNLKEGKWHKILAKRSTWPCIRRYIADIQHMAYITSTRHETYSEPRQVQEIEEAKNKIKNLLFKNRIHISPIESNNWYELLLKESFEAKSQLFH